MEATGSLSTLETLGLMANQQRPKSLHFKSLLKLQLLGQAQHVVRSLNNAKSMVSQLLNKKKTERKARKKKKKKLNWKSSSVTRRDSTARNDSTTILGEEDNEMTESEHNSEEEDDSERGEEEREIDRLAEKFIASCHEKFRLEKQESFRRYQEMLARSI